MKTNQNSECFLNNFSFALWGFFIVPFIICCRLLQVAPNKQPTVGQSEWNKFSIRHHSYFLQAVHARCFCMKRLFEPSFIVKLVHGLISQKRKMMDAQLGPYVSATGSVQYKSGRASAVINCNKRLIIKD